MDLSYLLVNNERNPQRVQKKILSFLKELQKDVIDIEKLKEMCRNGIPDECKGLRALCWKILIGYLPPDRTKWQKVMIENQ